MSESCRPPQQLQFKPLAGLRAYEYLCSSPSHAVAQWHMTHTTQLPLRGQRWNIVSETIQKQVTIFPIIPNKWAPQVYQKIRLK